MGLTVLRLRPGLDLAALRSAAARLAVASPIAAARLCKAILGVPRWVWRVDVRPSFPVEEHREPLDELCARRLNESSSAAVRFDVLGDENGSTVVLRWRHLMLDAKGAELFLAEIPDTAGTYAAGLGLRPTGGTIASASEDQTLRVWNAQTAEPLLTLQGHTRPVSACAYSPDGQRIASASGDQTLRIWDAQTGELLLTLTGHTAGISACAYSPDGWHIASACWGGSLRIWDLTKNGEERIRIQCFGQRDWAGLDRANNRILWTQGAAWRRLGWLAQAPCSRCGAAVLWANGLRQSCAVKGP